MHGFGIARRVGQISRGVFKVNPGSLLTALQRLERGGWVDVGNASAVRDEVRASAWEHLLDTTIADVVYAARRLRADRAFAIVSVLTLALGIGATAAIFSAIKPILAEPLPYPHPERIVTIADFGQARAPLHVPFGPFRELSARTRSVESLAVMKPWLPTLTGQA